MGSLAVGSVNVEFQDFINELGCVCHEQLGLLPQGPLLVCSFNLTSVEIQNNAIHCIFDIFSRVKETFDLGDIILGNG